MTPRRGARSDQLDFAIIGAGPQALAYCLRLSQVAPAALERTKVFDPAGWLTRWDDYFSRLGIQLLRSGATAHPGISPDSLQRFARMHYRDAELSGQIGRPSTALFEQFCRDSISAHGLNGLLEPSRVTDLRQDADGPVFAVDGGRQVRARRVVLATNPMQPILPLWASLARDRHPKDWGESLAHSDDVDFRGADLRGQQVLVVGGGLTAGQVALSAARARANVTLRMRGPLRTQDLDVASSWLGPELAAFLRLRSMERRLEALQKARPFASMTDEIARAIQHRNSGVRLETESPVEWVTRLEDGRWRLEGEPGGAWGRSYDRVICATGSRFHVDAEPLLRNIRRSHPAFVFGGLPQLDTALHWPGTGIQVLGGLAALEIGPFARNLAGAQIACDRTMTPTNGVGAWRDHQFPQPNGGRTRGVVQRVVS